MTNATPTARPALLPRMPWWVVPVLLVLAGWFLTTHYLHVYSELINWDEFAILERAERTLRFGKVIGDGRPGLITIVLMPFVKGCIDATRSVVEARLLWQVFTVLYLAGVYALVRRWFAHAGRPQEGHVQGLLAVALLVFLPAFVVWSVQVRTDQAALAATVWAGVLLLSTGYGRAAFAGALIAIGLLCTQKGIYTVALVGLLYATATAARAWPQHAGSRAEIVDALKRLGVVAAAAAAVIAIYYLLVPDVKRLASGDMVMSSLETMRFSRQSQGYRIYTVHMTRLVVHWVLFAVLLVWTGRAFWNRERQELPLLAACWLTLALGLAVIVVHGSAFPYFIMTAGLFPALALSMAAGRPLAATGRSAWPIVTALVAMCALQSVNEALEMLEDTQKEQRDTLRLVYDSPLKDRRGYQVEGALLCMRDPDPLPTMFSPGVFQRFYKSPKAAQNIQDWIGQFRSRPVAYIVHSHRLTQFPQAIRDFWANHYVWYAHSLYVTGYNLEASQGDRDIDVIAAGRYRWDADPSSPTVALRIDGKDVSPGGIVTLAVGPHHVEWPVSPAMGQLILADLPPPTRDLYPAFYHQRQLNQLGGYR